MLFEIRFEQNIGYIRFSSVVCPLMNVGSIEQSKQLIHLQLHNVNSFPSNEIYLWEELNQINRLGLFNTSKFQYT